LYAIRQQVAVVVVDSASLSLSLHSSSPLSLVLSTTDTHP
jgi:hypothetical protein